MNTEATQSPDRAAPPSVADGAPARLGEYRLLREVGRGGMGVVYEAVQESLDRPVALKVLPPGLAARGSFLERFRREARVAAGLHHTNIVAVYGIGEQDGSFYYAMQFIQGQGLDAVLQDVRRLRGMDAAAEAAPTSVRDGLGAASAGDSCAPAARGREELVGAPGPPYYRGVARLGRQAAEALAYAHGQGVVHRDVKPSNLLIDAHGVLWVTDFGLAKADDDADLTAADDPVGTLRYMAPERFSGRSDARGDVYALGATLYEMLTLRPAFEEADRMRLIARVTQEIPRPPRQWAADVPRDLETIVLKAMAREPADRYATAAALADDLRRFLEDRPILARRASILERLRRWRRRNPTVAGLALATAILLLLLAAGSTVAAVWLGWQRNQLGMTNNQLHKTNDQLETANGQLTDKDKQLEEDKSTLEKENDQFEKEKADKTDKLWRSLYQTARALRFSPLPGRRFDGLAALADARRIRFDDRLRTEAVGCLALTDLKPGRMWVEWPPGSFDIDFDASLERYARSDRHGAVSVCRTYDDAEIAHVVTDFDAPTWVELSPDGRFIAVRPDGASGRLQVWRLGGKPERRIEEPSGVTAFAFSAEGLLAVMREGNTSIYDLSTGQIAYRLPAGPGGLAAAFRADGRRLAAAGEKSVGVYDLQTGEWVAEWPTAAQKLPAMQTLAWRPDGALLAGAGRDGRIYFWDPAERRVRAVTETPMGAGVRMAFNHAGDLLAARDASEVLRLWNPRTGRELFSTPSDARALRFSPDDRQLAGDIDGARLRIWQVACGREYRTLVPDPMPADAPEFSGGAAIRRDGRLLAAAMSDGVRLWDLADRSQCAFLHLGPTAAVAFDADDALLTTGTARESAVVRRPIRAAADHPEMLTIGPPETLNLRSGGVGLACSRDGRTTAVATLRGVMVQHPDHPGEPIVLQMHDDGRDDVRDVAVSPDGRYVAACSHGNAGVRIWDVLKGAIVTEAPMVSVEGPASAVFSPDGKWLAAGGKTACRVWAVGTWQERVRIDGAASAFTPEGALLAVETGRGVVRLVDPETGKIAAQLEDPHQDRSDVYFTPDGARMVAVSLEGRCVHVWDLRRIRQGLAEIDLDWDRPPFPLEQPAGAPLRVSP